MLCREEEEEKQQVSAAAPCRDVVGGRTRPSGKMSGHESAATGGRGVRTGHPPQWAPDQAEDEKGNVDTQRRERSEVMLERSVSGGPNTFTMNFILKVIEERTCD